MYIVTDEEALAFSTRVVVLRPLSGPCKQLLPLSSKLTIRTGVASTDLAALPPLDFDTGSLALAAGSEGWRQYVPLVVSCGVIVDILLGSPIANQMLAPMRRASTKSAEETNVENGGESISFRGVFGSDGRKIVKSPIKDSKERIDSVEVAEAALNRARNSLELRKFLEENKTDQDRYAEIRKKIDSQMRDFDSKGLSN